MSVQMAQAKIKREQRQPTFKAAANEMFAAINAAQPEGIRYASCLLPDSETFVAFAADRRRRGESAPGFPRIPGTPGIKGSLAEPPLVNR